MSAATELQNVPAEDRIFREIWSTSLLSRLAYQLAGLRGELAGGLANYLRS